MPQLGRGLQTGKRLASKTIGRLQRWKNAHRPRFEVLEQRALLTTYDIGPGQAYTTLGSFPWTGLLPGDTVDILWQAGGYHEKLLISESGTAAEPINIVGVPGPDGQQPIIDGEDATTSSQFHYYYTPLEENSLVLIQRSADQPYEYLPSYINISGLEFRDAYQDYTFTDATGATQTYAAFAAAIYVEGASNITIANCTLDNSGLGLFALSNGDASHTTSDMMVEGNYFYGNGVPGSNGEHNSYCEVDGITYQDNDYGPLRAGSLGAELKDRSAGAVIRDNYFSPAAHMLDLVDAEDSPTILAADPAYANTYVYGNILDNTGANYTILPVYFGGDSGDTANYRPNLYFYDNTVVDVADQSSDWRTIMFELATSAQNVYAANNIFYDAPATVGSTPTLFEFSTSQGNISFSPTNWVSPGWLASEAAELDESYSGTITGTDSFFVDPNNNPGFLAPNGGNLSGGDYHLLSTSNAIGIAGSLDPSSPAVTEEYAAPTSSTSRTSVADAGAFEAGPAIPTVIEGTPAPDATSVPLAAVVTATFNEAVQAGTIGFALTSSSGSAVAATVAYDASTDTATLTPSAPLVYGTTYTATVTGAEDTAGDPMDGSVSWSFTTDYTTPAVTNESPANGATDVASSTTVSATFNEPVQSGTIDFTLTSNSGGTVPATVSYNSSDDTVTLTPSAALASGTTYSATVSGAQDAIGDAMSGSVTWTFTTSAAIVPSVTGETPSTGATGVATNTDVTATFSEAVQSSSVNVDTFVLEAGSSTVTATVSYDGATDTATLTPSTPLASSTTYTVTISGVVDESGHTMAGPDTWSFTTAAAAIVPAVITDAPASGATGVAVSSFVTATFNEAVQNSSVNVDTFVLEAGSSRVTAVVSYDGATDTATLIPSTLLAGSTTYTVTISGVADESGHTMAGPDTWSFTTAAVIVPAVITDAPASGATGVAVSSSVTATFNEAVQSSSVNVDTFMLEAGSSPVTAAVSYNSATDTATLTPSTLLAGSTTYTVTISGVADESGHTMAGPVTWSFTTAAVIVPAVITDAPASGATGVAVSSSVTATFNEPVQPSTISFTLTTSTGGAVAGTVSYNSSNDTVTLNPSAALAYGTTYTAVVSGAKDADGDPMNGSTTWSFTTSQRTPVPPVTMTGVRLVTNKKHLVTQVLVTFSGSIDVAGSEENQIYRLATAGKHGSFTARNAHVIQTRSAVYDAADDTVTLTPKKPFSLSKPVQLVVDGEPPSGLEDNSGRFINGGSNAVALLHRGGAIISALTGPTSDKVEVVAVHDRRPRSMRT
jgi:methionine-rich copper-binding protein CopC